MNQILLLVTYFTKPGKARPFAVAVEEAGLLDAIHNEQGCVQYEYFISVAEEDKLLLVERWADQAALDAHAEGPYLAELKKLQPQFILKTEVVKHNI